MVQKVTLEDGSVHTFPDDATQEEMTQALASIAPPPQQQRPQSFGEKALDVAANNPVTNFALGAGDTLRNIPLQAADIFGANTKALQKPSGEGAAYGAGELAGNIGAFLGGGEGLQGARFLAAGSKSPQIARIAELLGKSPQALNRVAGASALGGIQDEDDRLKGALTGGALAGGFELAPKVLPAAYSSAKKTIDYMRPEKQAKKIISELGDGKSLEDNAKSLAHQIGEIYKTKKKEASKLYANIFGNNDISNGTIYDRLNPSGYHEYLNKPEIKIEGASEKLSDQISNFNKNPTAIKAHKLQSDLGKAANNLSQTNLKSGLSSSDMNLLEKYKGLQSHLKDQIQSYLSKKNPELSNKYQQATDYYKNNLGHYLDDSKIKKIATGQIKNPKNILNVFKNPEEKTAKIVNDLGQKGIDKILYSAIGHNPKTITSDKLVDAIATLDKRGLGSYLTPDKQKLIEGLERQKKAKKIAQIIGGMAGGAAIGNQFMGNTGALLGAGLGYVGGAPSMDKLKLVAKKFR